MSDAAADRQLLLSEQLCFALYSASRAVTDVYRPMLAEFGLTYPQYLVLLLLWEADPRTVKELGEALHLDYGTMSPLLKRLEAHELIVRARSGRDERTVLISLTARGRDLRDPVAHVQSAVACTLAMDPARHADLLRTLHSLAHTARTAPVAATPSPPVAQRSADPAG